MHQTSPLTLFGTAQEAWEAMLRDIETAQKSIYIEQYLFQADTIGERFLVLLESKARQGVVVRLLFDCIGSWQAYKDTALHKRLERAGVELRWYNRVVPLFLHRLGSWYFRDHRKILVVDEETLHIGGVGVRDNMRFWRDTHGRLRGVVAQSAALSFHEMWFKARRGLPVVLNRAAATERRLSYTFLPNSHGPGKRFIYKALSEAIRDSRKRVWLTTPYFIPDLGLFRALQEAAERGVDVKLILPGTNDLAIMAAAMRSYYGMAIRSGIQLFAYQKSILHAKSVVVDDSWATFGSMNLDSVSFRFNAESNIVVRRSVDVARLADMFIQDMGDSEPITFKAWHKRPLREKVVEVILWPLHGLL